MDLSLTDDQKSLRDELIRFARAELNEDLNARDTGATFSRDLWSACARYGVQGLLVPAEFGGSGADPLTIVIALEALGYGCRDNGLLFSLGAQMWSCELPFVRSGTEEQKRRYLPGLCDGSLIGVHAITEPEAGSDALGLRTTAVRKGDSWVLNGTKTFITNAPIADVFIVFARTDPAAGSLGLTAFVIERDTAGLSVGDPFDKMGLRTSPLGELVLADCVVNDDAILGRPGSGMAIFNSAMEWERTFILAPALGTMQRSLEDAVTYAREREQSGSPIGKFQAVSHRIADMKVRLDAAQLLLYKAGWLLSQGKNAAMESAIAKLYISESFLQSSLDALQTFGGYGYMRGEETERDVRDAIAGRIYSGTSDVQRNLIAAHLGL